MNVYPTAFIQDTYASSVLDATAQIYQSFSYTMIDKFTAINTSSTPVTISIYLADEELSELSPIDLVVRDKVLQPAQTYTFPEIVGHIINPNDCVWAVASAANAISIRASGRNVTL